MKKFSKMFALMLLAGALVVGFASCSNGSDDSSSSSSSSNYGNVVATFKRTDADIFFKFYDSKNFQYLRGSAEVRKGTYELTGTWTAGSCKIKPKSEAEQTLDIDNSSFEYDSKTFAKQ